MKCNRKKSLPTGEVLREINSENIRNADLYLNYISRSMMLSLRYYLGFGQKRFRNFNEGHSTRGQEYITVYVLVNYWSAFEDDLRRIYTLEKLGYDPYVMIYNKPMCDPVYLDLQRWCNCTAVRKKCPNFEDYKKEKPDERQCVME